MGIDWWNKCYDINLPDSYLAVNVQCEYSKHKLNHMFIIICT